MKILIVSQYFWPENFRVNDLAIELQSRGHEVTVLTGKPNYPDGVIFPDYRDKPEKYLNYNGVKVFRVPLLPRGTGSIRLFLNYLSFVFSASILGPVKLSGRKFDRIFVFEPSPITVGLPAIVLKYIKKAPILFWVLDLWPETLSAINVIKSKIALKYVGVLVSFIYKNSDLLLAQSRSFISSMKNYCDSAEKIQYFPSWAEDIFFESDIRPAKEVPVTAPGMFSVMFAGNIGDAQDFSSILDAAELLKVHTNIRWLIVGDGRMAEWVKQEAQRRGLDKNFIMLGRHSLERMPSFYTVADALLVSLKDETIFSMTIPGKVQSYLASGKPIVAMLNGEGAKIIQEAGAGYVCNAGDGQGLSEIILEMASNSDEERSLMGKSGRKYYKEEFDKNVLIDRLESWLVSEY
ncbi:Putative glycosyltransferase [hydrothermal vent metagenome]|uniref:Glycosyltransferase n=1 Tax=hydrothermal vent metagenome TaxID=652676 RepID=A0A3B1BGK6_9ZZZZ